MAGKISRIWDAIAACFIANNESLAISQIVAWIGVNYPDNDFNPVTLKAQIYRSCSNTKSAQEYKTPKILFYDKTTRKYSKIDIGSTPFPPNDEDMLGDVTENLDPAAELTEDVSDLIVSMEAQLRDYLAKNLSKLEQGLSFWTDTPPSIEYSIDGRRIDILARDLKGVPVVVELKRGRAYDRVVGQALLYQALVRKRFKLARVRVILVANEITDDLRMASSSQSDFELFEYELSMQLKSISSTISEEDES